MQQSQQANEDVNTVLWFRSSSPLNPKSQHPMLTVTYTLPPEIEGLSSTTVETEELSVSGDVIAKTSYTTTDHGYATEPIAIPAGTDHGLEGTPASSGCRNVWLKNHKYNLMGVDLMYTYKTFTGWCFFRSMDSITVNTVKTDWDIYIDNETVSWDGQVKKRLNFYEWVNGEPISGHKHYRKGHLHNDVLGHTTGHSYPINIIRAHSDGTWSWWTDD